MNSVRTSSHEISKLLVGSAVFFFLAVAIVALSGSAQSEGNEHSRYNRKDGKRLFTRETFGGNGRTCLTCHSAESGTVSPEDARERFACDLQDPLFVHDGSDDRQGNGVDRMLKDATILVEVPLPENVSLADDPTARSVISGAGHSEHPQYARAGPGADAGRPPA
jgi:hypothetical protein